MKLEKTSPLFPTPYTLDHVAAIQALEKGEANSVQQKMILEWIINSACGTYDNVLHLGVDGQRESDIAGGKRFVGLTLVKLVKINLLKMKEKSL